MSEQVVVKITRYLETNDGPPVEWVSGSRPAWVRARKLENPVGDSRDGYDLDNEETLIADIDRQTMEDEGLDWDHLFSLTYIDTYKIIPTDEWPDEVCVAVAKLALTNERKTND